MQSLNVGYPLYLYKGKTLISCFFFCVLMIQCCYPVMKRLKHRPPPGWTFHPQRLPSLLHPQLVAALKRLRIMTPVLTWTVNPQNSDYPGRCLWKIRYSTTRLMYYMLFLIMKSVWFIIWLWLGNWYKQLFTQRIWCISKALTVPQNCVGTSSNILVIILSVISYIFSGQLGNLVPEIQSAKPKKSKRDDASSSPPKKMPWAVSEVTVWCRFVRVGTMPLTIQKPVTVSKWQLL